MKDLLVVVADLNMKGLVEGLLPRIPIIENIPSFSFEIQKGIENDPGMRTKIVEFCRPFLKNYNYLIVLLDHEGSGFDGTVVELQNQIQNALNISGWENRVCAIVIEPECDIWMWVNRNKMSQVLKSPRGGLFPQNVDDWLINMGFNLGGSKPKRPKEALDALCREIKLPRSSSIYFNLSSSASYKECTDSAFLRFLNCIRNWFSN